MQTAERILDSYFDAVEAQRSASAIYVNVVEGALVEADHYEPRGAYIMRKLKQTLNPLGFQVEANKFAEFIGSTAQAMVNQENITEAEAKVELLECAAMYPVECLAAAGLWAEKPSDPIADPHGVQPVA